MGRLTSNGVIWGRIILGFSSPTETKLWVRSCSICANMLEKINLWHLTFISQYLLQRKQLVLRSGQKPEEKCYLLQRSNSTFKKISNGAAPKRSALCRLKKTFQKMLILVFLAISYCTFFMFNPLCSINLKG